MSAARPRNFRYLNGGGAWPGFSWAGLNLGVDGATLRCPRWPR